MSKKSRSRDMIDPSRWQSNYGSFQELAAKAAPASVEEAVVAAPAAESVSEESDTPINAAPEAEAPVQGETMDTPAETDPVDHKVDDEQSTNAQDAKHDWEKRFKDSQRYIQQLKDEAKTKESELQKQMQDLQNQLKQTQVAALPKTEEELMAFAKEDPEAYALIDTMIQRKALESNKDLEEQKKQITILKTQIETQQKLGKVVELGHADAYKIWEDKTDLLEWLETQTPGTKGLFTSEDPRDWSEGLTRYKKDRNIPMASSIKAAANAATTATAASMIPTKATTVAPTAPKVVEKWSNSKVRALSAVEYAKHRDVIRKAQQEGNFIYD